MRRLLTCTTALSVALATPYPIFAQVVSEDGRVLGADGTVLCEPTADTPCIAADYIEQAKAIQDALALAAASAAQAAADAAAAAAAAPEDAEAAAAAAAAQAEADAAAGAAAQAEAEAAAAAAAQVEADAAGAAQAEAEAAAAAQAEADAAAAAQAEADAAAAAQADADAAAAAQADADAAAAAQAEADAAAAAQADADAAAKTQADADAAAAAQADADAAAKAQADADAAAAAQADADAAAKAQADADAAAQAQADADAAAKAQADADAAAKAQADADAAAAGQADADAAAKAQADADAAAAAQAEAAAATAKAQADAAAAAQAAADAAGTDAAKAAEEAAAAAQAEAEAAAAAQAATDAAAADAAKIAEEAAAQAVNDAAAAAEAAKLTEDAAAADAAKVAEDSAAAQAAADAAVVAAPPELTEEELAAKAAADAAALATAEAELKVGADGVMVDPAASLKTAEPEATATAEPVEAPVVSEVEVQTLNTLLVEPSATDPTILGAAETLLAAPLVEGELPSDQAPSADALVTTTEVLTEQTQRSSAQEFAAAPVVVDGGSKRNRLSDLEKVGLVALGALVVGAIIKDANNKEQDRRVVSNTGDRVVVLNPDGTYQVYKDDDAVIRRPGSNVRTETYRDGSTRTIVERPDGTQVVTIRDATGRVLRRAQYDDRGRELVLIDDLAPEEYVVIRDLPKPRATRVVISTQDDDSEIKLALAEQDVARVGRKFSLRQIREIPEVRALAATIDVDAITFDSGSAAIRASEANDLADLGSLMKGILKRNPREVFLIEGHTDATGAAALNLALSDRRAESVALALTEYFDIPPENMVIQGYGETELRIDTLANEKRNRRVAVRVIGPLLRQAR